MCSTGATAGRLDQSVGSFPSTYSPECTGQESRLSECPQMNQTPGACSGDGAILKVYVTCFVNDPVVGMSPCNIDELLSTAPAASVSELPTGTTTVAPSAHSTTSAVSASATNTDSSNFATVTVGGVPDPSEQGQGGTNATIIIAAGSGIVGLLIVAVVISMIIITVWCKQSRHRDKNFNDQVSPDSPVKVRKTNEIDSNKDLEPGMYSELNNSTVVTHQVPIYDTVNNKSQNLSEVSASDSNDDNHTYSALDPDAIYTQIPPHLGLTPGNSSTLPAGLKGVSPSTYYQKLDRSLSLPRTTEAANSATGYILTHAVNRTALALESGNIDEADLASPRSDVSSIKYPSPHSSPKQHHSSSQSSTSKEELPLIRNPTNAQMENYYHVLDQGVPTPAATAINATTSSDIDSQVSTDAVCNQQLMDNYAESCRQPHCHSPRRQQQRAGAAAGTMGTAEGDHQHFYAVLEPSVRAQLTPPSRHETRQRTQSSLNNSSSSNRSPPQQQRMRSNTSKSDMRVNYSSQRVINNFSQSPFQPNNPAEVTNTLV